MSRKELSYDTGTHLSAGFCILLKKRKEAGVTAFFHWLMG
jgi:hypothetical protein